MSEWKRGMTMIGSGWYQTVIIWKNETAQTYSSIPIDLTLPIFSNGCHSISESTKMNRTTFTFFQTQVCWTKPCIGRGNVFQETFVVKRMIFFLNYFFPFLCLRSILNSWAKRFISDFWFEKKKIKWKKSWWLYSLYIKGSRKRTGYVTVRLTVRVDPPPLTVGQLFVNCFWCVQKTGVFGHWLGPY